MRETDNRYRKEFTAPRGGKFTITSTDKGMFFVHMSSGGQRPAICDQLFTNRVLAEKALLNYFQEKPEVISREAKKAA